MNKRNVLKLAKFIQDREHAHKQHKKLRFQMADSSWPGQALRDHKCGTAGCIGGFAAVLWSDTRYGASFDDDLVAEKLGLSESQLLRLCYEPEDSRGKDIDLEDISREGAVETLRNLAKTGKIRFLIKLCKPYLWNHSS